MSRASRLRRWGVLVLAAIAGAYLVLCTVARIAYPRMLFPAPRLGSAPAIDGSGKLDPSRHAAEVSVTVKSPATSKTLIVTRQGLIRR